MCNHSNVCLRAVNDNQVRRVSGKAGRGSETAGPYAGRRANLVHVWLQYGYNMATVWLQYLTHSLATKFLTTLQPLKSVRNEKKSQSINLPMLVVVPSSDIENVSNGESGRRHIKR